MLSVYFGQYSSVSSRVMFVLLCKHLINIFFLWLTKESIDLLPLWVALRQR